MILGIDHVQIAAPPGCEKTALRFFGELLGLPEIEKPANLAARGGAWFQSGNQQLHIGVESEFMPAKKAHPAFAVREIARLRERLESHGIVTDPGEPLPGAERFYVSDPFGNRLEFLEWKP
ncbi:MAG TPA: VOC family protein [Capsulimonadaceae bacterium]|nr:VOC family protein [Capsulimonadaceae bacterium]